MFLNVGFDYKSFSLQHSYCLLPWMSQEESLHCTNFTAPANIQMYIPITQAINNLSAAVVLILQFGTLSHLFSQCVPVSNCEVCFKKIYTSRFIFHLISLFIFDFTSHEASPILNFVAHLKVKQILHIPCLPLSVFRLYFMSHRYTVLYIVLHISDFRFKHVLVLRVIHPNPITKLSNEHVSKLLLVVVVRFQ